MIKGMIFDADGTLLDSMPIWDDLGVRYLKELGVEAEPGLPEILFRMSLEESAAYMKRTYGLSQTEEEIRRGVLAKLEDFYVNEVQAKPGVDEFLRTLHERQVPMMIATSSSRHHIEEAMRRLGFLDYFAGIITCEEVGAGKSRPDIYLKCAETMGLDPEEVCVVEDVIHAVRTANAAGFPTAGVYDAASAEDTENMKKECSIYLHDLTDYSEFCRWAFAECPTG